MHEVEQVRNLELALQHARRAAAKALAAKRAGLGLTLVEVATRIKSAPSTLSRLENAHEWNTKRASKLASFYETAA